MAKCREFGMQTRQKSQTSLLIAALIVALTTTVLAGWQFLENRKLSSQLAASEDALVSKQQEVDSLEVNLRSAHRQLQNLSSSLQDAREEIQGEARLRTSDDLSSRLHGTQPPNTSVVPPPGYTGSRPPGSSNDIARQMAEMQANVRYGEFVASLQLDATSTNAVRNVIANVFAERVEVSRQRASGTRTEVSLEDIATSDYLREQLAAVLDNAQLALFDQYETSFQQRQQRNTFAQELARYAPGLSDGDRQTVLDVVLKHLGGNIREGLNPQANAVTETQRQLAVLTAARMELRQELGESQMMEAEKFLSRIQSGMVQSQTMNEGADN